MEDQRDTTNYCPLCEQNARAHNDLHEEVERLNGLLDEIKEAIVNNCASKTGDTSAIYAIGSVIARRKGEVGG